MGFGVRFEGIEIYSIVPVMLQRMFVYNFYQYVYSIYMVFVPFSSSTFSIPRVSIAFNAASRFQCVCKKFYLTLPINHGLYQAGEFYIFCVYLFSSRFLNKFSFFGFLYSYIYFTFCHAKIAFHHSIS